MKKLKIIPFKRKLKGKTDYRNRLKIIASNKLRIIIRKSLKGVTLQIAQYKQDGDFIITSANTKNLKKFDWKPQGNISSAYLTGLLCGVRTVARANKDKGFKTELEKGCVSDIGMITHKKGGRIYAALKGVIDAGIKVSHSEGIFPGKERIEGKDIKSFEKSKNKILEG